MQFDWFFEFARAKMARKSWNLYHKSCWVALAIHLWRSTSTLFQPRGADYAHQILNTGTLGFSNFPTALLKREFMSYVPVIQIFLSLFSTDQ